MTIVLRCSADAPCLRLPSTVSDRAFHSLSTLCGITVFAWFLEVCRVVEKNASVWDIKARIPKPPRLREGSPSRIPIEPKNAPVMDPQDLQKPLQRPFAGFEGGCLARSEEKNASV